MMCIDSFKRIRALALIGADVNCGRGERRPQAAAPAWARASAVSASRASPAAEQTRELRAF